MATAPLPTGAITFAFTDIEGSTQRWERDREAMQDAVRRHDAILRAAVSAHGGYVFKTIGDAFCSAFASADDATRAMLVAQRALAVEDFSPIDGLRVRAAIHSGTADERDGDYFGPPLNKVARLLAIGHGGQVLLTAETAEVVREQLRGATLRDLGTYHLKDIAEPERVFQLIAADLPADFPPLRSLGALPSDLSVIDAQEFHPVAGFTGRDEVLSEVHNALGRDDAIAIVHGLGGMGKSSLAREYGRRNRDRYSIVWWLNAQTETAIIDGLLRLGATFVYGLDNLADRRAAAQRVIHSLLAGFDKPVLLVFDNLEDERLLRTWLPRTARALATSRETTWGPDVALISLQVWPLANAVEYLQRESRRPDVGADECRVIAQTLGALPLAVAHAAAALRTLRMLKPQQYLERIAHYLERAPRGTDYPRSVFATLRAAIAQAEQQAPGAAAVLCLASRFAPDGIPDELFRQSIECYTAGLGPHMADAEASALRPVVSNQADLDEALGALDRLSLLTFTQRAKTYAMHRLVQLAARDLGGEAEPRWRECAVAVAEAAAPKEAFESWPQLQRLVLHARTALDALPENTGFLPAASLADRCALYLHRRGDLRVAEELHKRALAIQERVLGPDHRDVARTLYHLGVLKRTQGEYDAAERFLQRSVILRENIFGPDDVAMTSSLLALASLHQEFGRYVDAARIYQRVLSIQEPKVGLDHPDAALTFNNLASVHFEEQRYDEAELLYGRALSIFEKALGADHPHVGMTLYNLAEVNLKRERYEAAQALATRSHDMWASALGPDHAQVALPLATLAEVDRGQGRYEEAEQLHRQSLTIRERALGPDHPWVAVSLHSIATMYCDQGRRDDAAPLLTRALSIRERTLGVDHPSTQATREALSQLNASTTG